jgi:CO/xanthine dehydrogenase Mo-binding subunit
MKTYPLEVGRSIPRVDAYTKVTGEEKYASDFRCPGLLFAGVKRAGAAHARIKAIHTEEARRVPGVLSVLTWRDVGGTNRQGAVRKDQPVLVDDKVRHAGDPVALVVAADKASLSVGIERIALDLEPLPAVFDPEEALGENGPRIHEDHAGGNMLLQGTIQTGKGETGLEECDVRVEAEFRFPFQEHACLETESGWAVLREDGSLEITASTQTPFRDRMEVAEALGLKPDRVRIIAPYCGGAFGGKDGITVQSLLGLSALHHPGRCVKMVWSREESFLAGPKRHPVHVRYTLGAMKDGAFHALKAHIIYDTGPYDHLGGAVMALGLEHAAGPYRIPHCALQAWCVYTNNPIGGAFRGFGVPQVNGAMEQMVDRMARALELSPLEIRVRNGVRRGDKNAVGVTLTTSTGMILCLETLRDHPLWKGREAWKASAPPQKWRGIGLASVMHGMGYGPVIPDAANAKIELTEEGKFRVYSGVVDMGQGNASTYLQIAGDILLQDSSQMEIVLPDTAATLPSGSASASRTTYTFGNALILAAEEMKRRLLARTADFLMARGPEEVALSRSMVRHLPSGREIPLRDLATRMERSERVATAHFRAPTAVECVTSDPNLRLHGIPHLIFSYGVHLAFVEVDRLTGAVGVKHYLAVTDCGRVINPQLLEQQIQGGIAQGIGYGLMEEFQCSGGKTATPDLSTYLVPTSLDLPDMETVSVAIPEGSGPFGLKGAGEIGVDGPLPAIANAVADACGVRVESYPLKPERVLAAFQEKEKDP